MAPIWSGAIGARLLAFLVLILHHLGGIAFSVGLPEPPLTTLEPPAILSTHRHTKTRTSTKSNEHLFGVVTKLVLYSSDLESSSPNVDIRSRKADPQS